MIRVDRYYYHAKGTPGTPAVGPGITRVFGAVRRVFLPLVVTCGFASLVSTRRYVPAPIRMDVHNMEKIHASRWYV